MAADIESWMCAELAKLGIDASEDNARYILGIESGEELEEYMLELLDGTNTRTQKFIKELLQRWRGVHNQVIPDNVQVYRKPAEEEYIPSKQTKKKKGNKQPPDVSAQNGNPVMNGLSENHVQLSPPNPSDGTQQKKKSKFVPLFSQEGQAKAVVQLAGRHVCNCQAAKHELINNCTRCGRVVCKQEGSGPCLFCGNLVCTAEEQEALSRGSKKSDKLRQFLMKDAPSMVFLKDAGIDRDHLPAVTSKMKEGLDKAVQHKEKLLEFDRTSVRRTQVIDDESDYFSTDSNQWLSKTDREALRKREAELRAQKYASRKDRKVTLDFAGRKVIEDGDSANVNMYDVNDEVVQQVHYGARPKVKEYKPVEADLDNDIVNPLIVQPPPQYIPPDGPYSRKVKVNNLSGSASEKRPGIRIQDKELQEMSDEGMCMSMHQPWASLLVKGIKMHEGRTWYTAHRGRLWIAATAKPPTPQETADVEQSYRYLMKDPNIQFPDQYPVGCLLGCVDVVDCLSQEQYQQQFPDGESASPYVFICESPMELLVKFPIKGKHKIYKLEPHTHQAAKKGLR